MVQFNPGQSNGKEPCTHMRWEPIEIPTKRQLSGHQQFQVFSLRMRDTQPSKGEVSFGKKSQPMSCLMYFKVLKHPSLTSLVT